MSFARIDYFGDAGGRSGWSGTVSSLRELDRIDWGDGRKAPSGRFGDGGISEKDVQQIVKRALKDSARRESRGFGDDLARRLNAADKGKRGVTVAVKSATDAKPDDESMIVPGARKSSTFPMASRVAYDQQSKSMALFVRRMDVSGLGRITAIGPEERINVSGVGGSFIGNADGSVEISGPIEIVSASDSNVKIKTKMIQDGRNQRGVLEIGVYYL